MRPFASAARSRRPIANRPGPITRSINTAPAWPGTAKWNSRARSLNAPADAAVAGSPAWLEHLAEGFVMIRVAANRSESSVGQAKPADRLRIFPAIAETWRELRQGWFAPYRHELHYI